MSFRFVFVEMVILGFDIWSFVFVYGYIDPKWGMFWFLSLMIMSLKTLLTGKSRPVMKFPTYELGVQYGLGHYRM